jgi:hypothetical protein
VDLDCFVIPSETAGVFRRVDNYGPALGHPLAFESDCGIGCISGSRLGGRCALKGDCNVFGESLKHDDPLAPVIATIH